MVDVTQVVKIRKKKDLESKLNDAGKKLVVIVFEAGWCGPCKMMAPKFEELAANYPMALMFKVDVDECEEVALEYKISSMPTYVLVRENRVLTTFSGANADRLRRIIDRHVNVKS